MLEYLLTIVLIIVPLLFVVRSKFPKSTCENERTFGQWIPVSFVTPLPPPYPDWLIEKTHLLPYRPFKYGPDYFITMGIGRLDLNDWIELDNQWSKYHQELKLSRLCKKAPEASDAALETMELLSEYLVYRYPSLFEYQFHNNEKQIHIKATGEMYSIQQRLRRTFAQCDVL